MAAREYADFPLSLKHDEKNRLKTEGPMKQLEKFADYAYALMRIMTGFMFSFHGVQKIFGILSEHPQPPMGSQIWIGGIIELVGCLMILVGFQTRWAAFLASGTMAAAYFQFHWKFQLDSQFFPAVNQGEMAVLYCFIFLYIACRGGVQWNLDKD
jgi:putative oxidoreductase